MDLHRETALISAVLALAITVGVLLRSRKRRTQWLFIMFASNVAVWYLASYLEQSIEGRVANQVLGRVSALAAVLLPQTAVRFLRAFQPSGQAGPSPLDRWATWLAVPMFALVASPYFGRPFARAAISAYVVGLLVAAVSTLYTRGRQTRSRMERARTRYLVGVSIIATLVTGADLLPFIGLPVPPVGSIFVLAVLYMFSEVTERSRLVDLYELGGRFIVLTALALVLAGIYYLLVDWQRQFDPYFLNAIVASLVILILFDPLRAKVEGQITRVFFRERFDLEQAVTDLKRRLTHVLELEAMGRVLLQGLESSRRVTDAALYLMDAERRGLDLFVHLGAPPVTRVELASARPLLDHVASEGAAVRDQLEREQADRREQGEDREVEKIAEVARSLDALHAAVAVPLQSDAGNLVGLLVVRDDRLRDAFSPDEVQILRGLGAQAAIVVENSKLHARIKQRDRLAALGEMATGLAHEIRNPLGSIKAAAQFMESSSEKGSQQQEFLGIILEEAERLDRVVTSFLDYARPYRGNPAVFDVALAVERTLLVARNDLPPGITLTTALDRDLPPVRMDPEHLRQVVLNLVRNAVEAMEGEGAITVRTLSPRPGAVEVHVKDSGPGIDPAVLPNLFIPFFTTKASGTGLGLAICQRLVESAGGSIDVRSAGARGTTFVVALPPAEATAPASTPPPAPAPVPTAPALQGGAE